MPQIPCPTNRANGLTAGIDWARDDHAVAIVDARGQQIVRQTVEHSDAGLARPARGCSPSTVSARSPSNAPTARSSTPCSTAGLTVVVISPNQVKNLRGRYGSAGNKDDRFDAFVLADTLRTDRARLRPLTPDSPATVTLRRACRARKDLVAHRVARGQPAARTPAPRLPRRRGPVRRHRLPDQPDLPDPLRLPGPRRLALAQTPGRLAGQCRLLRPNRSRRAARPPDRRTPRRRRRTRRRRKPHHPSTCWPSCRP